jgi:glycosyltransferase involved in cell wall biosynthesis
LKVEQDNKRKVLIIARDFLPYYPSLGGVIRVVKMAQFLQEQGCDVYVLCARGEEIGYFGYEDIVNKLKVVYVDDKLQRYYNKQAIINTGNKEEINTSSPILQGLKNLINDFCIPDKGIFFVNRYVNEASKLIVENNVNTVIVSSPPHSTQLIGLNLKRKFGNKIKLIVDYRDSWNTTAIFQKRHWLAKKISLKKEKEVLRIADKFTYISRPMLEKINSTFMDISNKSLLIMNGFDLKMNNEVTVTVPTNKELTIGYFGGISDHPKSFRNPTRFFNVVSKLSDNINLVFYGSTVLNMKWKECLGDKLKINETIAHTEALELMKTMDLLLVVHSESMGGEEVLTGKIFDYFLAQRPVLVVGPKNMEAARLVRENQLGYCLDIFNEDEMVKGLQEIHRDWQQGQLVSYSLDDVVKFSRQQQYAKLLEIL